MPKTLRTIQGCPDTFTLEVVYEREYLAVTKPTYRYRHRDCYVLTHIETGRAVYAGLYLDVAKELCRALGDDERWTYLDALKGNLEGFEAWPESVKAAHESMREAIHVCREWAKQNHDEREQTKQARATRKAKAKQSALPAGWVDVSFSVAVKPQVRALSGQAEGTYWNLPHFDAWTVQAWGNTLECWFYSAFPTLDASQLECMVLADLDTFEPLGNVCKQRETKKEPTGLWAREALAAFPQRTGLYQVHLCAHYAKQGLQPALWDAKEGRWRRVGIVHDVNALLDVNATTCPWVDWTLTAKVRDELGVKGT